MRGCVELANLATIMNEEEEVWSLAIAQSSPLIRSFWMGQYLQLVEGRQPHCDIRK